MASLRLCLRAPALRAPVAFAARRRALAVPAQHRFHTAVRAEKAQPQEESPQSQEVVRAPEGEQRAVAAPRGAGALGLVPSFSRMNQVGSGKGVHAGVGSGQRAAAAGAGLAADGAGAGAAGSDRRDPPPLPPPASPWPSPDDAHNGGGNEHAEPRVWWVGGCVYGRRAIAPGPPALLFRYVLPACRRLAPPARHQAPPRRLTPFCHSIHPSSVTRHALPDALLPV